MLSPLRFEQRMQPVRWIHWILRKWCRHFWQRFPFTMVGGQDSKNEARMAHPSHFFRKTDLDESRIWFKYSITQMSGTFGWNAACFGRWDSNRSSSMAALSDLSCSNNMSMLFSIFVFCWWWGDRVGIKAKSSPVVCDSHVVSFSTWACFVRFAPLSSSPSLRFAFLPDSRDDWRHVGLANNKYEFVQEVRGQEITHGQGNKKPQKTNVRKWTCLRWRPKLYTFTWCRSTLKY